MAEFDGIRSKLYKESLREYPKSRLEDIEVMKKYLKPQKDETILEVGAGSGFFSNRISELVGENGKLVVADPSSEQLEEIKSMGRENIGVTLGGAEDIELEENLFDSVWSFGAMHHCFKKKEAFEGFHKMLKQGGKVVIGDVFAGSKLAEHFDVKVDKYCATGHHVEFWTDEMVKRICKETRFQKPQIIDLPINWKFNSKKDLGLFLYKIHAMTKTTPEECLKGAEEILGVKRIGNKYHLNWPMKVIIAEK